MTGIIYITGNTAHAVNNLTLNCVHFVVAVLVLVDCFHSSIFSFAVVVLFFFYVCCSLHLFVGGTVINLGWYASQHRTDKTENRFLYWPLFRWLPLRIVNSLNRHSQVLHCKSKNSWSGTSLECTFQTPGLYCLRWQEQLLAYRCLRAKALIVSYGNSPAKVLSVISVQFWSTHENNKSKEMCR